MGRHANATKRFAAVALVFDITGFCFNLVGIFGPAWLVIEDDQEQWSLHEGIWLAKYCTNATCKISTREHALQGIGTEQYMSALEESHWTEFKVLSIIAIVGSLLAIVMTTIVLVMRSMDYYTLLLIVGGVSALSSSMVLLIPVLKLSAIDSNNNFTAAWARIVAGVGVFLYFLATICELFAVYQNLQCYCAIKQYERSRQRRLEMVVQYLTAQSDNNENVSVSQPVQPVIASSGELRTLNSDSGIGSGSTPHSGAPPYTVATELPTYSEITMR